MGNPLKGEVTLEAGDSSYRLVFNINTLCTLEEYLDMSMTEIGDRLNSGDVRISFMRSVIWAGLQEHHPDLTAKDAGVLIGVIGPAKIGAVVSAAFANAFKGGAAGDGTAGPRKRVRQAKGAGTGSTSSKSGTS